MPPSVGSLRVTDSNAPRSRPKRRLSLILPLLLVSLHSSCSSLRYRGAMIDARDAMTEGRFDQAILDLDRASRVTGLSDEEALELAFLRAQCLEALRRTEEATALYRLVPSNASSAELVDGAAARLRELGARAPENGRI